MDSEQLSMDPCKFTEKVMVMVIPEREPLPLTVELPIGWEGMTKEYPSDPILATTDSPDSNKLLIKISATEVGEEDIERK